MPAAERLDAPLGLRTGHARQPAGQDELLARQRPVDGLHRGGADAGGEQALDHPAIVLLGEERVDGRGDLGADVAHLGQLLLVRCHHPVERPELLRQRGGGGFADLPDAESDQEAGQGGSLAPFELRQQVLRRLLAHALERDQRGRVEVIEIGQIPHEAALDELVHQLLPEPVDVERAARAEEAQRLLEPRRTGDVDAAIRDLVVQADHVRTADRALRSASGTACSRRVPRAVRTSNDVGDDVAGALEEDGVADAHVLALDLVHVVQRRVARP